MTALRLHAIILADAAYDPPVRKATGEYRATAEHKATGEIRATAEYRGPKLIPFRDLCAVVSEQSAFVSNETSAELVDQHRKIVDSIFLGATVLPAPVGVVFRAPDVLKRWMELHYVSLSGALEYVDERAVARVHVVRADGSTDELEAGSDLAAAAAESLRALRRHAVAAVALRLEEVTGLALSSAFLVERSSWKAFLAAADEQQSAHHLLKFTVSGPWAPYDFVHMQFGG